MRLTLIAGISVLIAVLSSGEAQAITYTEIGDAGESLDTAQTTTTGPLPIDSISGTLSGDADLFKIFLTGGQTFSATTINTDTLTGIPVDNLLGNPTELLADPQLFLFDSSGKGVYANDDTSFSLQSILPSGPGTFSPVASGIYYLGIASSGYNPFSAKGQIFPDDPSTTVFGPTGPGGSLALTGFKGDSTTSGRYTITLTGVQGVPEPTSVLGILALGILGFAKKGVQKFRSSEVQNKFPF